VGCKHKGCLSLVVLWSKLSSTCPVVHRLAALLPNMRAISVIDCRTSAGILIAKPSIKRWATNPQVITRHAFGGTSASWPNPST
jgi:hypothetical protein